MEEAGRKQPGLAAGQLNTRLIMQPIITLGADGRTAKGTWHELAMLGHFGSSATWAGGIYENEYVEDQGKWKLARVQYFPQYAGAFDAFGHKAPAKWGIPYHFEARHVGVTIPDAAITALAGRVVAAPAATRIADLQQRLTRLRDETEVRNLQHSFGYYLDRKLWDDVADLFADGGSLELAQRGAYVGPARIREALEKFHGPALQRGELFDDHRAGWPACRNAHHAAGAAGPDRHLRAVGSRSVREPVHQAGWQMEDRQRALLPAGQHRL
jgi:hypothetical protein